MGAKEKLLAVQAVLEARGVKDVKFCFGDMSDKPLSQVASEVADALQEFLSGNVRPLAREIDGQTL